MSSRTILIKFSGETISSQSQKSSPILSSLAIQIAKLHLKVGLGLVVGGGNFFRGTITAKELNFNPGAAHELGMLGTLLNGRFLEEILRSHEIATVLLSALYCPSIADSVLQSNIDQALAEKKTIIFCGGTGTPFFSTDTAAVVRALQLGAAELWKATKVDGVYDKDPIKYPDAQLLKEIGYKEAIAKRLEIMDLSALVLAEQNDLKIRVFNAFDKDALLRAFEDKNYGSIITK